MARIGGVNIPNHQHAEVALTAIYGVGRSRARKICVAAGIETSRKMKDLSDSEMDKLREQVGKFATEGDLRREEQEHANRHLLLRTFAAERERQRHHRIEMRARDMAHGIGHGQHGEAEGQRDAQSGRSCRGRIHRHDEAAALDRVVRSGVAPFAVGAPAAGALPARNQRR